MKKSIISIAFVVAAMSANALVITQWTFEGDVLTPSTGSGTLALIGGPIVEFATGWDRTINSPGGRALNSRGYPNQGEGSGTAGVRVNVSTAGYMNIVVDWDHRSSNTSSRWVQFQYSTDGTSFTSAGLPNNGLFEALGGDMWDPGRTVNLSSIANVADNPNFAFRIVAVFAPGTQMYMPSNPNSSYSPNGTQRFDNVTISGDVVPEPTSLIALAVGLAALVYRRRK